MSSEQPNYEYFSSSSGSAPFGSRYRTNASSSSSLGQGYPGLGSDSLYPPGPSPFADSLSSFPHNNHNSFDLPNGLPSSYSSGKVSPLTPNDSVTGLQNSPGFPNLGPGMGKDAFPSGYGDLVNDRRASSMSSGSFQSDFHDDFASNGALGLGFSSPSPLQHFQERISHYNGGLSGAQHLHHRSSLDMMRGVNPHATHGGIGGFDDMGPFPSMAPTADLLRLPSQNIGADEMLSRMKLQHKSAWVPLRTCNRSSGKSSHAIHSFKIGETLYFPFVFYFYTFADYGLLPALRRRRATDHIWTNIPVQ